ncbi:MAG TPA: HlyD family efflux transporter periplasmic adaptor subunit [Dehalococcoidia bacterium]|nr:HlyD family efflux transporter periplasmic adaptor subunit [Dehalococcoidia bacterium]
MKRMVKIALIVFIIVGLALPSLGCGSEPDEAGPAETQIATVERGDLTVEITAAGNLALSRTEDLSIDLFYQEGTVEEVLVEEGDIVEEGQALVKLDTEEWEDNLDELQDKLTEAERALTAKKRALVQAERKVIDLEREVVDKEDDVTKAERQVTAKEIAVSQAQLNLDTAEYDLSEIDEVKEAQDAVDEAEDNLRLIRMVQRGELGGGLQGNFAYWNELEVRAEEELAEAQEELQEILNDLSTRISDDVALDVAEKQLQVKQKQLALEDAQIAVDDAEKAVADARYTLEDAQLDVEDARHDVGDAQLDVEDAQKALGDTQEELEKANSKSPIIVAPFDGFITKVNVEGGDEVLSGTVAVQLADPNKFEAEIMVSEMDISQIKEGGEAWVQVDALSGLTLPAEVTHISPTATISQGVVNYKVKVEVASPEEMMQEQQAAQQEAAKRIQEGELPERLQQAIEEGRITQEQAEEMINQMQQLPGAQQWQLSSAIPEDFQLREGLTVTVTIVVAERSDVLLVPNAAITTQGGQSYVQVVSSSGDTEQRTIRTGISDWQYTEVTEGLSEGEQVIVPQGTTVTSTTQSRGPGGGIMFGPPPR